VVQKPEKELPVRLKRYAMVVAGTMEGFLRAPARLRGAHGRWRRCNWEIKLGGTDLNQAGSQSSLTAAVQLEKPSD